jgi:hypothetical protein
MKHISVLFALCLLSQSAHASNPCAPYECPTPQDYGGKVSDYLQRVNELNATDIRVTLRGTAGSAAIMYLGVLKVCTYPYPKSMFIFHSPSLYGDTDNIAAVFDNDVMRTQLIRFPRLKHYVESHGYFNDSKPHPMTGTQAIALGVPNCEKYKK